MCRGRCLAKGCVCAHCLAAGAAGGGAAAESGTGGAALSARRALRWLFPAALGRGALCRLEARAAGGGPGSGRFRRCSCGAAAAQPAGLSPPRRSGAAPPGAGRVVIGLHARGSAEVVDLSTCLLLAPPLLRVLPPLRAALASLSCLRREGSAILNLLDSGPDLLLRTDRPPSPRGSRPSGRFRSVAGHPPHFLGTAAGLGGDSGAARAGTDRLSGVAVAPPPGAFLQATAEGEAAIIAAVLAGLPGRLPGRRQAGRTLCRMRHDLLRAGAACASPCV